MLRGCSMQFRVFSSNPGLYPLDANGTTAIGDDQKCLQTLPVSPGGAGSPLDENHRFDRSPEKASGNHLTPHTSGVCVPFAGDRFF